MNSRQRFSLVILLTLVFASAVSHALARWLRVTLDPMEAHHYGAESLRPPILVAGSSLTFFAVDWEGAAVRLGQKINTFACATASPCEIEAMPFATTEGAVRVIGISRFEMNEERITSLRPELVPLLQTAADLRASRMGWDYCKKLLGQYPAMYARIAFPTAGRSGAVMVGLRGKARQFLHGGSRTELSVHGGDVQTERLTDWDAGRLARNLSSMRASGGNREVFGGPKLRALARLAGTASTGRPLVILILPVSPLYQREVGSAAGLAAFDAQLEATTFRQAGVHVLRADRLPEFDDAAKFCDLVHINLEGRAALTPHVEKLLTSLLSSP